MVLSADSRSPAWRSLEALYETDRRKRELQMAAVMADLADRLPIYQRWGYTEVVQRAEAGSGTGWGRMRR